MFLVRTLSIHEFQDLGWTLKMVMFLLRTLVMNSQRLTNEKFYYLEHSVKMEGIRPLTTVRL